MALPVLLSPSQAHPHAKGTDSSRADPTSNPGDLAPYPWMGEASVVSLDARVVPVRVVDVSGWHVEPALRLRRHPPMRFPARYQEPTQPRANALETGPGGARRNYQTRRHDRTGRPAKKCMRAQAEEAERRRMSHSRWWGSLNCGCKP